MMKTPPCSVTCDIRLERAVNSDYKRLYGYHYRTSNPGPIAGVWVLRPKKKAAQYGENPPIGVIVYGMSSANLAARSLFAPIESPGGSRQERLAVLNRRLRTIRRVIIDPRYRGLGLAARLVRQTLPRIGTEWVEAYTVMGRVSGFFERAGMQAYNPPERPEAAALRRELLNLGIDEDLWWDSRAVFRRLEKISADSKTELQKRIAAFLKPYKNRRVMPWGPDQIRFLLSRLAARPVYYLWNKSESADRIPVRAA